MSSELRFFVRENDTEECHEVLERDAIPGDDDSEENNALIARFYTGHVGSVYTLAHLVCDFLNDDSKAFERLVGAPPLTE